MLKSMIYRRTYGNKEICSIGFKIQERSDITEGCVTKVKVSIHTYTNTYMHTYWVGGGGGDSWHSSIIIRADEKNAIII